MKLKRAEMKYEGQSHRPADSIGVLFIDTQPLKDLFFQHLRSFCTQSQTYTNSQQQESEIRSMFLKDQASTKVPCLRQDALITLE
jgi:hypothetical protein